jgi:predicted transcriptional regulator
VGQTLKLCHNEAWMMAITETLRVRVDRATAKRVQRWAKEHDTDVSDTIRRALAKLLDEDEKAKRIEEGRRKLQEAFDLGLFDPPREGEEWKAGGFR